MEPKVIEEIAEQLGMAVGEAAKFIESILPQYAGMQVLENSVFSVMFAIPTTLTIIGVIWSLKATKEDIEFILPAILLSFIAAIFGALMLSDFGDALGWALFPDAKLLDMAVKAVM